MKFETEKNKEVMLEALERSLGIVTAACKDTGITRQTFYNWYNSDDAFKLRVDDINDITLDFTENQLLKKIKEGSERSILFYMKYKGRKRGYSDNIDITSGGDKITGFNINIIRPEDKDGD
jgi:hypothetical protein